MFDEWGPSVGSLCHVRLSGLFENARDELLVYSLGNSRRCADALFTLLQ